MHDLSNLSDLAWSQLSFELLLIMIWSVLVEKMHFWTVKTKNLALILKNLIYCMWQMVNPMIYVKAVNAEMDLTHRTTTNLTANASWLFSSSHLPLAEDLNAHIWSWHCVGFFFFGTGLKKWWSVSSWQQQSAHVTGNRVLSVNYIHLGHFSTALGGQANLFSNIFKWSQLQVGQQVNGWMYAFAVA